MCTHNLFDNQIQNIGKMGCQNSNLVEVIPIDLQEPHDNHHQNSGSNPNPNPKPNPACGTPTPNGRQCETFDKENRIPSQLSIKLHKQPGQPINQESGELSKRKSKSEYRITEIIMNDTTNVQENKEQRKKSLIILEKCKTHSAKEVKEKSQSKKEVASPIGPSTHSIPEDKLVSAQISNSKLPQRKKTEDLTLPIMVNKEVSHKPQVLIDQPQIQSLSEEMKSARSARSGKSFKFQIYVESTGEILSNTQKFNNKMQIFMEKQEVNKYLDMLEYGDKQEILGKLYEQLEKKEEWNEMLSQSSKSCEPLVIVVTQKGETFEH